MAQQVHVVLVDDLDGSDASQTVTFGLDGAEYEIDLTDENASKLREALAPYTESGRKVARARRRAPARNAATSSNTAQVREWARQNGYTVSDRGRVPAEVQQAFTAAH